MEERNEDIVNTLSGSLCPVSDEVMLSVKYGIDIEDIEDIMLDGGYDRCPACEHWVECCMFDNTDEGEESEPVCNECHQYVEENEESK